MNTSTSDQRGVESAHEVSTCVTPSHAVYASLLGRYLVPEELLACQGIFRCDASDEKVFDTILQQPSSQVSASLAQDLAGNSFTGTVIQAVFLTTMASSDSWQRLQPDVQCAPSDSGHCPLEFPVQPTLEVGDQKPVDSLQLCESFGNHSGKKRKLPEDEEPNKSGVVKKLWVSKTRLRGKSGPPGKAGRKKRVTGKDLVCKAPTPKRKHGAGPGNKHAKGKKAMATIAQKEAIFAALETAKKNKEENPYKAVAKLNLPGFFTGCTFPSKWGKIRQEQRWDLLMETAPHICKKFRELPNSIRRIMHMKKFKHGDGTSTTKQKSCLPHALKEVIEGLIMDRIDLGEEVSMPFVKSTILFCCNLWNENVLTVQKMMEAKQMDLLQLHDEKLSKMTAEQIDQTFEKMNQHAKEVLQVVNVAETDGALLQPGCTTAGSNGVVRICTTL